MVNKRHQALRRKPFRLCESMNGEAVNEREEDIGFYRRIEIATKLSCLLAFLKKLFEADTKRAVPPAVINCERLVDNGAKNDPQPQSRGCMFGFGNGKDKEKHPAYPL